MGTTHVYDRQDIPIRDQGVICNNVHIENNVWIGAKVTINAGITVAYGCVIGANAVITKNTERNGVYVGVPAKKIKMR
jgi:acetyltransferase-like isoleucine patch superfamily enzyme